MIYYINPIGTKHIKIGYTKKSPKSRMRELQTGSSFPLQLLGFEDGDTSKEKELHKRFADTHILLEWFDFSEDLINHINNISNYYVDVVNNKIQIYKKMKQ